MPPTVPPQLTHFRRFYSFTSQLIHLWLFLVRCVFVATPHIPFPARCSGYLGPFHVFFSVCIDLSPQKNTNILCIELFATRPAFFFPFLSKPVSYSIYYYFNNPFHSSCYLIAKIGWGALLWGCAASCWVIGLGVQCLCNLTQLRAYPQEAPKQS